MNKGQNYIGSLNIHVFSYAVRTLITDEVIITDKQIEHINNHHSMAYEKYSTYIPVMLNDPDFIIEANKPNTAIVMKTIQSDQLPLKLVLRIITENDNMNYKNSVITFMRIRDQEWRRLLNNKKILYSKEWG